MLLCGRSVCFHLETETLFWHLKQFDVFLLQVILLSSQNGNGGMSTPPDEAIAYFTDNGTQEEKGQNGADDGAYRSHLVRQMKDWLAEQVWEVGKGWCSRSP
jgi:hypothetical protein